jgi:hypothetical protein
VVVTEIVAGTVPELLAMVRATEFDVDPVVLTVDVGASVVVNNELVNESVVELLPLVIESGKDVVIDIKGGLVVELMDAVVEEAGTPDSVVTAGPANVAATVDVGPTAENVEDGRNSVLAD